jgi:hypothetical protein
MHVTLHMLRGSELQFLEATCKYKHYYYYYYYYYYHHHHHHTTAITTGHTTTTVVAVVLSQLLKLVNSKLEISPK